MDIQQIQRIRFRIYSAYTDFVRFELDSMGVETRLCTARQNLLGSAYERRQMALGYVLWKQNKYPRSFPISHAVSLPDGGTAGCGYHPRNGVLSRWLMTHRNNLATTCKDDIPFPRSGILTVTRSLPSNLLELEVSPRNFCWVRVNGHNGRG
jgi:hypothetical protein